MPDKKIIKCLRCKEIFNDKSGKWEEAEQTKEIIARFNRDKLLVGMFGQIEMAEKLCPDCQQMLPNTTPKEFRELSSRSKN